MRALLVLTSIAFGQADLCLSGVGYANLGPPQADVMTIQTTVTACGEGAILKDGALVIKVDGKTVSRPIKSSSFSFKGDALDFEDRFTGSYIARRDSVKISAEIIWSTAYAEENGTNNRIANITPSHRLAGGGPYVFGLSNSPRLTGIWVPRLVKAAFLQLPIHDLLGRVLPHGP